MTKETTRRITPLAAAAAAAVVDQASKLAVMAAVGSGRSVSVIGDFLRLSPRLRPFVVLGAEGGPAPVFQIAAFIALPLLILGLLVFFHLREKNPRPGFRWCAAAVIGGGLGNLIDRFARGGGAAGFLDVRAFGLFGLSRWPVFGLADLAVTLGAAAFVIVLIVHAVGAHHVKKRTTER